MTAALASGKISFLFFVDSIFFDAFTVRARIAERSVTHESIWNGTAEPYSSFRCAIVLHF